MVRFDVKNIFLLLTIVDLSITLILNGTSVREINNKLIEKKKLNARRKMRSTSSSSTEKREKGSLDSFDDDESLKLSGTYESSSSSKKKYAPKSTEDLRGWRKWHRVCPTCPEDMVKKWRDPSIKWICGGYQRARRTFKSECMMYYRNCQDGTMFVKLYDNRCKNDTQWIEPHGVHFFYDYKAVLTGDSSKTSDSESSSMTKSSDD